MKAKDFKVYVWQAGGLSVRGRIVRRRIIAKPIHREAVIQLNVSSQKVALQRA
jgi:hypothetical protein